MDNAHATEEGHLLHLHREFVQEKGQLSFFFFDFPSKFQ